jgi:phosphohistidine phosphatase
VRVYLIRHGHAVDAEGNLSDEQRYLSKKGRKALREIGRALKESGVEFDAIVTSPLVRAVQTAEMLAERTDYLGVIEALPALLPGVPPRICASELPARGAAVAVVGHEPGLTMLGAFLCGRPSFPAFRKGQVSLIEDGRGAWFLHPDTLARERLIVA